jgi:hypothetical protein
MATVRAAESPGWSAIISTKVADAMIEALNPTMYLSGVKLGLERSEAYKGLTVWCNEGEERAVCVEPVTDRSGKMSL